MSSAGRSGRGRLTRSLRTGQRLQHVIAARVDGTGTAALLSGSQELTLVDTGTGDYLLTYKPAAFAAVPVIVVTPLGAAGDVIGTLGTVSATSAQILFWDGTDGTTAKDADFHIVIIGADTADEV